MLFDKDMPEVIKGFRPNVSITLIMSVCFGGGFAGPGNVEENALVKVIGLYTFCPNDGTFDAAIRAGIEENAQKAANERVTANDLKGYLTRQNWPLGAPFDDKTDNEVRRLRGN